MRRMVEDEFPLPLCLSWSSEGLDTRRFVLQENDTGEIIVSVTCLVDNVHIRVLIPNTEVHFEK